MNQKSAKDAFECLFHVFNFFMSVKPINALVRGCDGLYFSNGGMVLINLNLDYRPSFCI